MVNSQKALIAVVGLLMLLIIGLSAVNPASAHPREEGDSYTGPHTCRTNCAYWGHTYGEWHNHNDPPPAPARTEDPNIPWYGNSEATESDTSVWNTILSSALAVVLFGPFVVLLLFGKQKS